MSSCLLSAHWRVSYGGKFKSETFPEWQNGRATKETDSKTGTTTDREAGQEMTEEVTHKGGEQNEGMCVLVIEGGVQE